VRAKEQRNDGVAAIAFSEGQSQIPQLINTIRTQAGIMAFAVSCILLTPASAQVTQQFNNNQSMNQAIVDDLQQILDRQSRRGQTPRNNPILRDIQNAIRNSGLTPFRGSPGGPTRMTSPQIAITNNGPGTLLLELATGCVRLSIPTTPLSQSIWVKPHR